MTAIEFIKKIAIPACGVNEAYGDIADIVFEVEKGNDIFSAKRISDPRERAKLLLPFNPVNKEEYEKCTDIIELKIIQHRQEKHNENYEDRIAVLKSKLSEEDQAIIGPESWWNH